jgi:CheY-like chemotaxis protein
MENTKRVLIAEDSSIIINLTKKIFEYERYYLGVAKNGKEVLDKLATEDYDVILMDINMPVMDGMECTRAIRALADKKKANIPIIIITGNYKNYRTEDFKAAGANEYIPKPLNFDKVVELVKKYAEA